ncbi:MAG: hypothetical protein P4L84_34300 [Isosphaeraceae bacterium]|nr:hypothetical protein [Isosphaeraceae bacterium]
MRGIGPDYGEINAMHGSIRARPIVSPIGTLVVLLALGCGDGAPAVSSSQEEATVHGKVTYQGKPLSGGEIRFNPANARRPDAVMRTATLDKDGSYTIKTLVGQNTVSLSVPSLSKKDPRLSYTMIPYDVQSGDNTFPVELPRKEK